MNVAKARDVKFHQQNCKKYVSSRDSAEFQKGIRLYLMKPSVLKQGLRTRRIQCTTSIETDSKITFASSRCADDTRVRVQSHSPSVDTGVERLPRKPERNEEREPTCLLKNTLSLRAFFLALSELLNGLVQDTFPSRKCNQQLATSPFSRSS